MRATAIQTNAHNPLVKERMEAFYIAVRNMDELKSIGAVTASIAGAQQTVHRTAVSLSSVLQVSGPWQGTPIARLHAKLEAYGQPDYAFQLHAIDVICMNMQIHQLRKLAKTLDFQNPLLTLTNEVITQGARLVSTGVVQLMTVDHWQANANGVLMSGGWKAVKILGMDVIENPYTDASWR